jgi:Uncharacterized protein conserved in bacteria
MRKDTVYKAMLFDFFGDLLTEKQREYFDLHYNEDFSLAEIAEQSGISRQGVWDIIRRAELSMLEAEEKTGVVQRFREMQGTISAIEDTLAELLPITEGRARELTTDLADKVADLKR